MPAWQARGVILKRTAVGNLAIQLCCTTSPMCQHYWVEFLTSEKLQFLFSCLLITCSASERQKTKKKVNMNDIPFAFFFVFLSLALIARSQLAYKNKTILTIICTHHTHPTCAHSLTMSLWKVKQWILFIIRSQLACWIRSPPGSLIWTAQPTFSRYPGVESKLHDTQQEMPDTLDLRKIDKK